MIQFLAFQIIQQAGSDEDFSENVTTKICSSLNNHIQQLKIQIPLNVNGTPAINTEWALN